MGLTVNQLDDNDALEGSKALLLLMSIFTLAVSLRSCSLFTASELKRRSPDLVNKSVKGLRHRLWNLRQLHLLFILFWFLYRIPNSESFSHGRNLLRPFTADRRSHAGVPVLLRCDNFPGLSAH